MAPIAQPETQVFFALKNNKLTRRDFIARTALGAVAMALPASSARTAATDVIHLDYPVGELEPVAALRQRAEWKQFVIFVWQWQNDVRKDAELYTRAGLHAFHIDRGAGEEDKVRLSLERKFPYYVDHAAGKGILYLNKDVQARIRGKAALQVRPYSLSDPNTIATLKSWLRENIGTTRKGLVYAYAFERASISALGTD